MALTAECIDRFVRYVDGNVSTTMPIDSIIDITVNNAGLLLSSTITVKRIVGAGTLMTYTMTGTGTECLGVEDALVTCIRDMGTETGYSDWAYP
jgi:hypothetical protein